MAAEILRINSLRVHNFYPIYKPILENISFTVRANEILGVIGESAAGKSITMRAVLGLLPPSMKIVGGEILFKNRDLLNLPSKILQRIRGKEIFLITQNLHSSLNPLLTIEKQFDELLKIHTGLKKEIRTQLINRALSYVGFPDPKRIRLSYPHQLSGGMVQRVLLGFAIALKPNLLILDEATSALDKASEEEVLNLVLKIRRERELAIIIVTHNINIIEKIADKTCVIYGGETIEFRTTEEIIKDAKHPYTQALLKARIKHTKKEGKLYEIPGEEVLIYSDRCNFSNRCPVAEPLCFMKKPVLKNGVRCLKYEDS